VAAGPTSHGGRAQPAALLVLHAWDRRRARAYAAGSPPALRALYLPGSGAGRADVRLLRDYAARGYRVEGMRMQVLAFRVLAHTTGRWRVLVTDRLARAVAVRSGTRLLLPRDRASTRVVTLVRGDDGRWRVSAVSGARRPAGRAWSGPRT
jgi:hypothetical protein